MKIVHCSDYLPHVWGWKCSVWVTSPVQSSRLVLLSIVRVCEFELWCYSCASFVTARYYSNIGWLVILFMFVLSNLGSSSWEDLIMLGSCYIRSSTKPECVLVRIHPSSVSALCGVGLVLVRRASRSMVFTGGVPAWVHRCCFGFPGDLYADVWLRSHCYSSDLL